MGVGLLLAGLLAGCGKGGSSSGGTPGPNAQATAAPAIQTIPPTAAVVGKTLTYDVDATDADSPTLTYSLETLPAGMSIASGTGVITWTPSVNQAGDHSVTVGVSDGTTKTTQSFTLSVFGVEKIVASVPIAAANGGVVTVSDPTSKINGLSVNIPPNAFPSNVTLTVSELKTPPTVGGNQPIFLKGFSIEAGGVALNSSVTITIPYDPSSLSTSTALTMPEALGIYFLDPQTGLKVLIENFAVDTVRHVITGTVSHFSEYLAIETAKLFFPPLPQKNSRYLPTILVHGWNGNKDTWSNLPTLLGVQRVSAWNFEWDSLWTSFHDSGRMLAKAIEKVKERTGQPAVNVLAHSLGGILTRTYLQGLANNVSYRDDVNKVMTLGTPHRGIGGDLSIGLANACTFVTCLETKTGIPGGPLTGSRGEFLNELNSQALPPSIQYHVIIGRELVRVVDSAGRDIGKQLLEDDGLITTKGADICAAFGQGEGKTECKIGEASIKVETIASSAQGVEGLCHTNAFSIPNCPSNFNIPMAQIDEEGHPLWPTIRAFLSTGSDAPNTPPDDPNAPLAPTGVTATAGNGQVTISHNAVILADSFNLYMASVPGVTKANYSTLPDGMKHTSIPSPFVHTGLTNGKTYYFVVTAVNAGGESSESSEVAATPTVSSPTTFTLTVAKAGGGTVTSNPAGISCGATCSTTFPQGQSVSLTAAPDNGFTFGGWSGACTNATGLCNLDMTSNKSVQALFNPSGGGGGVFDFAFGATPALQSVAQGSAVSYNVSTTLTSGTAQTVSLGFVGCPSGAACSFNPTTVTPSSGSTFTVSPASGTPVGTSTITLTATAGLLQRQATVQVSVTAAGGGGGGGGGGSTVGTWTATGSMGTVRFDHTATLLPNGKVLVAAGRNSTALAIKGAELYDPATGTWSGTGSLITARDTHTATLLQDGKVLVAGGILPAQGATASAELYNPATGFWANTGSMGTARVDHTATLLPNGKVLVAGGISNGFTVPSAELYDPTTGTWTSTGSMPSTRHGHTATLLSNGKVLVTGGEVYPPSSHIASSHLYDPNTGTWSATGSLNTARAFHTATLLANGEVLVTGGVGNGSDQALSSAEVYDPNTGTWSFTGSLNTARVFHPATLLPNGKVLVAGGSPSTFPRGALASTELYDLTAGTWTATGSMAADRDDVQAAMVPLNTGQVLMTGGVTTNGTKLSSAELYTPEPSTTATLTVTKTGSGSGTVTSSPAGINCGDTCTFPFTSGTPVVLTANPSTGSIFGGWSGACTGTSTCSLSMTGAKAVTATFTADTSGSGTVEGIVQNFLSDSGEGGTRALIAGASLIFRDSSGAVVGTASSGQNGVYSLALPSGTYEATATATGFLNTTLTAEVKANQVTVADPLLMVQEVPTGTGGISGQITDVLPGTGCIGCPLSGATVDLRRGINTRSGPVAASTTTDAVGFYAFNNLPAGTYTATASKAGYSPSSFTAGVVGLFNVPVQNGRLARILSPNEVQIVLTWGFAPGDLDAHLTGPILGSSTRFHVYFDIPGSLTSSPFARLHVPTPPLGDPEAITITQLFSGTYRFSVHDSSDRASSTSATLSKSHAQVKIYKGDGSAPTIFNVPPGRPGTLWTVFEMDGTTGVITPMNTLAFATDPAAIQ